MNYKHTNAEKNTITRNLIDVEDKTGNIYESIAVAAKRANQISVDIKEELAQKLQSFALPHDTLEEVFENREQIEISRFYERLPKPVAIALEEFMTEKVYANNPESDK